jgi:hypothetical protein
MPSKYRIADLPGYLKLFVGIFTTLILCVVLWAMFILYVDKGMVYDADANLAYESDYIPIGSDSKQTDSIYSDDIDLLEGNPNAELAPVWDSVLAGQNAEVDSATMATMFPRRDIERGTDVRRTDEGGRVDRFPDKARWYVQLRRNVGLAHTHINGQTLLFFTLGLIFMFTSVRPKIKKVTLWVFGLSVLFHAIGLSGESFHWFFDDLLALAGVVMLVVMLYMMMLIFVDLTKKGSRE